MASISMKTLCERVEAMTAAEIKKFGGETGSPRAYDVPILVDHLKVSFEIKYVSAKRVYYQNQTGLAGYVYLTGEMPPPVLANKENRAAAFTIFTDRTDRTTYMKMFDLCAALAENTEKALQETMTNAGQAQRKD